MRETTATALAPVLLAMLAACAPAPESSVTQPGVAAIEQPNAKPNGRLTAEPSGADALLNIAISWSARIVSGVPSEGLLTQVYERAAQLACPITAGDQAPYSYFAAIDNPNGDTLAATGAYQPWWNEDWTGTLTIDDTYHLDDPTLAGPEPVVHTRGTRPLSTGDTPLTVETDLSRARTRYLFVTPSTDGFQQEPAAGYEAKLVAATAAPMATMDFTLEGPIGGGKREVAVQGGILRVEWAFTPGRTGQ